MDFRITDEITREESAEILRGILDYNLPFIGEDDGTDLGVFLEDENGKKIAGLTGFTYGNWLSINLLWVADGHRKSGIGSQLLEKAEAEARNRGCKFVFLDTFSFQAPEFYKKHGYEIIFALDQCPKDGKRYYLTKVL